MRAVRALQNAEKLSQIEKCSQHTRLLIELRAKLKAQWLRARGEETERKYVNTVCI